MRWWPLLVMCVGCPAPMPPVAGGPCTAETIGRCDADAPRLLQCTSSVWQIYADCKGPRGCAVSTETADCDTTGNSVGDRCAPTSEGKVRCDPDGGINILRCVDGGLDVIYSCEFGTRCGFDDAGLTCTL